MQCIARNAERFYLAWLPFVVVAIFAVTATNKPSLAAAPQQQPQVAILTHECELLELTVNYPREIKVKNISDRQISHFTIEMGDPREGGIANPLVWGLMPHFGKAEKLLKPGDVVVIAIPQRYLDDFASVPLIEFRTLNAFMDNDETIMWSNGFFLRQDPKDWTKWRRTDIELDPAKRKKNHHDTHAYARRHSIPQSTH